MQMLTHRLGRQPYPELLLQGLGQLLGVPGALLGEFAPHEVPHCPADARRVAGGAPVGQTLQAPPPPAVDVASYTDRRAAGVRRSVIEDKEHRQEGRSTYSRSVDSSHRASDLSSYARTRGRSFTHAASSYRIKINE